LRELLVVEHAAVDRWVRWVMYGTVRGERTIAFFIEVDEFLGPCCGVCSEMRSDVLCTKIDLSFLLAILNFMLQ
jgi:hypothetical protein